MMAMQRRSGVRDLHVPKVLIRVLLDEGQPQAEGGEQPPHVRQWIPAIRWALRVLPDGISFNRRVRPTLEPTINLTLERVDRASLQVRVPVNRQAFAFFPALYTPHFSIQVNGNLLPGVETLFFPLK